MITFLSFICLEPRWGWPAYSSTDSSHSLWRQGSLLLSSSDQEPLVLCYLCSILKTQTNLHITMNIYHEGKVKTQKLLTCTNKKLGRLLLQYWHRNTLTPDSSCLAKIAQDFACAASSFIHTATKLVLIHELDSGNPTLQQGQSRQHCHQSHFKSNTSV